MDAVDRGSVDESGLLGTGDHFRTHPGAMLDRVEKFTPVFRLAHGAGRRGHDFIDPMSVSQPAESRQREQGVLHRRFGQRPAVESTGAEAHHLLFPIDDLERHVRAHLHHDHVDGVGADVDSGDAHGACAVACRSGRLIARAGWI